MQLGDTRTHTEIKHNCHCLTEHIVYATVYVNLQSPQYRVQCNRILNQLVSVIWSYKKSFPQPNPGYMDSVTRCF